MNDTIEVRRDPRPEGTFAVLEVVPRGGLVLPEPPGARAEAEAEARAEAAADS